MTILLSSCRKIGSVGLVSLLTRLIGRFIRIVIFVVMSRIKLSRSFELFRTIRVTMLRC